MTIRKKLWLMIGMAIIAVQVVAVALLFSKQNTMLDDRKRATRFAVETAWGIVESLDKSVAAGAMSKEEAQQRAIQQLKFMRYGGGKEYFWLNDMHPNMIMHPTKPEFNGKDISDFKDPNGVALFVEMVNVIKKNGGEGFVDYKWPRPDSDKPVPKTSFVKLYQPWGWVVGSGIYVDDVDKAIKQDAVRWGGLVFAIAGVMGAIAYLLARGISRQIKRAVLIAESVSNGKYDNNIVIEEQDEIADLLLSLNAMQQKLLERQETEQHILRETARLKCVLDDVGVCVRVADNDGIIIYINNLMRETLINNELAFQKDIPHFQANKIVGSSVGIFYPNPKAAIEKMRTLSATITTQLKIGGRGYEVMTTPVFSETGERLGTVAQWIDRTEQIKAEEELADILHAASLGDFNHRIPVEGKQGLDKQLAESMNELMATTASSLEEIVRVLSSLAKGNLTDQVTGNYQGIFKALKDDANATIQQLTDIIRLIKEAGLTIQVAAREIAAGNNDLSSRTESQASSLQETASSMKELTLMVQTNGKHATSANELALTSSEIAKTGVVVVEQVVHTMEEINESSRKIVDIISVIDSIAFQTNILALNAAVEAARAGEQGRGFAVVATEVRNLAQRAATAAGEIKCLIGDSVDKVENGTKLVAKAGHTMENIVSSIQSVSSTMSAISQASDQQTTGIEQVNHAIDKMDEMTQQNAALVEQAAASSESLEEQTQNLTNLVNKFKLR